MSAIALSLRLLNDSPILMKKLFSGRLVFGILGLLLVVSRSSAVGVARNWTNSLGGNWFDPSGWSPNGVPTNGDAVTITNVGTYTVLVATGVVAAADITVGGASGKQTFLYGSTAAFSKLAMTNSFVQANGVLLVTNLGITGSLTVKPGGELRLDSAGIQLYAFALTNQGTVTWSNGTLAVGGSNSEFTYVTNSGLFQILADFNLNRGGGGRSTIYNSGTLRKQGGTGITTIFGMDIVNSPSGVVDTLSGTLKLSPNPQTNFLAGSFTATAPGVIQFVDTEADAGATASGTGQFLFTSGSFLLQTNTITNLKFTGGDVYVTGTTTFQQAGAITNLTLDGANLRGTNRIAGTVTMNIGNVSGQQTVLPGGQLLLSAGGSQLYSCALFNQGTVVWSGGGISVGTTTISNGGTWTMTGNAALTFGGGAPAYFTNAGTIQKTGGTGASDLSGVILINLASGIIAANTGTLTLPVNYTNAAGEMRLNGGTLNTGAGTLGMTGGTLDGSGTVAIAAAFDGGTVSPGPGAGLMIFKSGLTLGTNVTLSLDGTGTTPGVTYDQLSVTGAVAISNCTLQVTSLPNVPVGTTFAIITNATASATTGNFNGLAENASLTISGQPFRVHYSGGNGNDVVLVRDSGTSVGALLSSGGRSNKTFRVTGAGNGSTIYTIQASTNFLQWTNVGFATGDVGGNFISADTNAVNYLYRFYRTTN